MKIFEGVIRVKWGSHGKWSRPQAKRTPATVEYQRPWRVMPRLMKKIDKADVLRCYGREKDKERDVETEIFHGTYGMKEKRRKGKKE